MPDDNLIIVVLYFPYLRWRDEVVLGFLASCQLVAPQVDWISEATAKYWAGRLQLLIMLSRDKFVCQEGVLRAIERGHLGDGVAVPRQGARRA